MQPNFCVCAQLSVCVSSSLIMHACVAVLSAMTYIYKGYYYRKEKRNSKPLHVCNIQARRYTWQPSPLPPKKKPNQSPTEIDLYTFREESITGLYIVTIIYTCNEILAQQTHQAYKYMHSYIC